MLGTILVRAPCKLCMALICTRFTVRIADNGMGTGAANITTCSVGCFRTCSTRGAAPLDPKRFAVRSRKTKVLLDDRKFSAMASAARSVNRFFASTSWVMPTLLLSTLEAKIPLRSLRGRVILPCRRFWAAEKQGQKISVTAGFCSAVHFTTSAWALAYSVNHTSLFSIISKMEISSTDATTLSPSKTTSANSSMAKREICDTSSVIVTDRRTRLPESASPNCPNISEVIGLQLVKSTCRRVRRQSRKGISSVSFPMVASRLWISPKDIEYTVICSSIYRPTTILSSTLTTTLVTHKDGNPSFPAISSVELACCSSNTTRNAAQGRVAFAKYKLLSLSYCAKNKFSIWFTG
mmetsp:Transcript_59089/g.129437  ORF Transcript_59089/g.129437 Transcript_59089/m.129437 type:complete len:351 (-) Transcript_59089:201-1253(-)